MFVIDRLEILTVIHSLACDGSIISGRESLNLARTEGNAGLKWHEL